MAIGEPEIQQVSNQLQLQLAMRIVTCRASGSDTVAAVLQRSASLQTHTPPVHSIRTGSATAWTVDMSVGGGEVVFPPSHLGQAAPQRVAGQGLLDAVVAVSRLRLWLWLSLSLGLGFWLPLSVLASPLPDSIKYCLLLRHNLPTTAAQNNATSVLPHMPHLLRVSAVGLSALCTVSASCSRLRLCLSWSMTAVMPVVMLSCSWSQLAPSLSCICSCSWSQLPSHSSTWVSLLTPTWHWRQNTPGQWHTCRHCQAE